MIFRRKIRMMAQNLSSAAVVIGDLRVKFWLRNKIRVVLTDISPLM